MKIVIRNSDSVALYLLADSTDVTIGANGMTGEINAHDIKSATHSFVTGVAAPAKFVGGTQTYISSTWAILNQAGYDLVVDAENLEAQVLAEASAKNTYIDEKIAARPIDYDELDTEVLKMLRTEVYNFDQAAAATPLCSIVAGILSVTETNVRNSVRTKGNAYYVGLVTAWANRRNVIGGA